MQRTIFHLPGLTSARDTVEHDFAGRVAAHLGMDFRLTEAAKPKRVALMASSEDHCLPDLLWRTRRAALDMSVVMMIANHADLADQVRPFGVPFIHVPARAGIRAEAERHQLDLLRGNVDLVARVDHRHSVVDLTPLDADVERAVLCRAVWWHCQDRIIRYGDQTIVF